LKELVSDQDCLLLLLLLPLPHRLQRLLPARLSEKPIAADKGSFAAGVEY
jgi:hypothetical protein